MCITPEYDLRYHPEFSDRLYKQSLANLRLVGVADLNEEEVNYSEWILCRSSCPPFKMVGMMTECVCHDGSFVRVALYDFVQSQPEADIILAEGTVLAIKAPYYKTAMDLSMCVRVDSQLDFTIQKATFGSKGIIPLSHNSDIDSKYTRFVV